MLTLGPSLDPYTKESPLSRAWKPTDHDLFCLARVRPLGRR
jgi:hypothetical protein